MSSAFLQVGSWSLNTKNVVFIRKINSGESWEVAGFRGLMNVPILLVDDPTVQKFRRDLPPGFVAIKSVPESESILINLEHIAGFERQAPRHAPGSSFGRLPASSRYFEENLGFSPAMVAEKREEDGVVYKLYTLVNGARSHVLTVEINEGAAQQIPWLRTEKE